MFHQTTEVQSNGAQKSRYGNFPSRPHAFQSIVTNHPTMEKVFEVAQKVADSTSTVLILGESGTGKELIARAIHQISGCPGRFVAVNCGAIPDNLLESELFGYEKGAFTGAVNSKPGRFVLADGGTIFLDEIGEMSPHLQVKLLRVLQDRVVEAVGSIKPRPVKIRVIAATHVDLREKVKQGKFREDLFYRLQVVPIELPALSRRKEDIELLTNYFSQRFAQDRSGRPLVFSPEVLDVFRQYSWPGNVRELENLIERFSLLIDGDAVYIDDLPQHIRTGNANSNYLFSQPVLPDEGVDFKEITEQFENNLIRQALQKTGGNKKAAAELLKLNRTTLVEKIKKKGLDIGPGDVTEPLSHAF